MWYHFFIFCFFFFSSRRRHTRFDCDWSSDVCSSDLMDHDERCASAPQLVSEFNFVNLHALHITSRDSAKRQRGLIRDNSPKGRQPLRRLLIHRNLQLLACEKQSGDRIQTPHPVIEPVSIRCQPSKVIVPTISLTLPLPFSASRSLSSR